MVPSDRDKLQHAAVPHAGAFLNIAKTAGMDAYFALIEDLKFCLAAASM
jgi:hypothetical protein